MKIKTYHKDLGFPPDLKYKADLRIPTEQQYAYIEVHVEDTPENIVALYEIFTRLVRTQEGLGKKEWNELLDKYMQGGGMSEEANSRMGKAQSWLIHELDKSWTRLKGREDKPVVDGKELSS